MAAPKHKLNELREVEELKQELIELYQNLRKETRALERQLMFERSSQIFLEIRKVLNR